MRISGTWAGSYRHLPLEEMSASDAVTLRLLFEQDWLGRLPGEAEAALPSGFPGIGALAGTYRFGRLRFTWTPRAAYRITSSGFAPMSASSQPQNLARPSGMPAEFESHVVRPGDELGFAWRITTWMMLAETRQKVQVILAHGEWRAEMQTDAGAK